MGEKTQWTDAQKSAIEVRGKTVLVSAAAGSGKTATLTERIIRRLTDADEPADIGRFLVVTFTKASAADLRKKISRAIGASLAEDPTNKHLALQMLKLGSADISTIDSFYYNTVKNNFALLGLPPSIGMLDEAEAGIMRERIMTDVIEKLYEKDDDGSFGAFMDIFLTSRGESSAVPELLSLYGELSGYSDFVEYAKKSAELGYEEAESPFLRSRAGKAVKKKTLEFLDYALKVTSGALEMISSFDEKGQRKYLNAFVYLDEHFSSTKKALEEDDMDEAARLFESFSPLRTAGSAEVPSEFEFYDDMRAALKKEYTSLGASFFSHGDKAMRGVIRENAEMTEVAYRVLSLFHERFMREKLERCVCDFGDCKHFALKLFVGADGLPTPLALEYARRYDEIYIDEYQDTDAVQDMIFAAIGGESGRFMVGDIKQSIYRFRGADPSTFARYKSGFPPLDKSDGSSEASIYMSHNFRCDKPIIDFTNRICGHIFRASESSVGYTDADDLRCGKKPSQSGREPIGVKLGIICVHDERELSKLPEEERGALEGSGAELEAALVTSEIARLLSDENELCDDGGTLRRLEPRDIAILTGTNSKADAFASALAARGIPTVSRSAVKYFENAEVLLALDLLNIIDNPRKDVYLAGALRSPLYGFNIDELAEIRRLGTGISLYDDLKEALEGTDDELLRHKLSRVRRKLEEYRLAAQRLGVGALVKYLYADTRMLSFAGSDAEGGSASERRGNLMLLYDFAFEYEKREDSTLFGFLRYLNDMIESGQTVKPPATSDSDNTVKVMTIHASKGLEFPVVFIVSCQSALKKGRGGSASDRSGDLISFDHDIGIGFTLGEKTGFIKRKNPIKHAISAKNEAEELEEQMRVLYVALTRARERLYLSATIKSDDALDRMAASAKISDRYSIITRKSYLDLIMSALGDDYNEPNETYETRIFEPHEVRATERVMSASRETAPEEADEAHGEALYEELKKRLDFEYPYSHLSHLPAKLSISKLYPEILNEEEVVEIESEEITLRELPSFLIPPAERATAAERGTATHTFMQFCDFKKASNAREEIARLEKDGFISPEAAKLINIRQIECFFSSAFYREVERARRVYREQRFNLRLPASLFTTEEDKKELLEGEMIAVQGVIDLVFEDERGDMILCDYKTDYLTREELENKELARRKLTERHRTQLGYYKFAVREIFGREPRKVVIYSLPLGEALEIDI